MSETLTRRSPVQHLLEKLQPAWTMIAGMRVALSVGADEVERAAMDVAGLCDVSCLYNTGYKGPEAGGWLVEQGIEIPHEIYATLPLQDGGFIARLGAEEFLLQSGLTPQTVSALEATALPLGRRVFRLLRQDAMFLLCGTRADEVLGQTCGIDFREAALQRVIFSRIAGVNCGILPEHLGERLLYRIWVDASFAASLWESLSEICLDLGGGVIGVQCLYPQIT